MEVYLLTLTAPSGKQYSLMFECKDSIDCEMMVKDSGINAQVEGVLEALVDFPEFQIEYIQ